MALSGGRTAAGLYRQCVACSRESEVSWAGVDFFWADERCVPPDDLRSNFGEAQRGLLVPLGVVPERVHRVRGEREPETAAAEAEATLRRVTLQRGSEGVLDLVVLGMGEDGHVASLFPSGVGQGMGVGRLYTAVGSPKPPPRRVTLTYEALAAARDVWVLISGAGKAQVLERALSGDDSLPLGKVLAARSRTRLWVAAG